MSWNFFVSHSWKDKDHIVKVTGKVGYGIKEHYIEQIHDLSKAIVKILDYDPKNRVLFDLSELNYWDSLGIKLFFDPLVRDEDVDYYDQVEVKIDDSKDIYCAIVDRYGDFPFRIAGCGE